MNKEKLIQLATEAREYAYVPYSRFPVGAALVCKNGKVYTGCNVENASYGLAVCAERNAIFKAVSEGERDFSVLAVIADTEGPCTPCGACRQVIREFGLEIKVVCANLSGQVKETTIAQLLPDSFGPEDLT
jgi:cytidine deaminase